MLASDAPAWWDMAMGLRDLFGAGDTDEPADETTVSVVEALRLLTKGGVIIDVRTQTEYERGHIPGSRLVAITDLQSDPLTAVWGHDPLAMLDPEIVDKSIVVVSSTPAHASAISHLLRDAGLNAYTLAGGLVGWVRDGQVLLPGPQR